MTKRIECNEIAKRMITKNELILLKLLVKARQGYKQLKQQVLAVQCYDSPPDKYYTASADCLTS